MVNVPSFVSAGGGTVTFSVPAAPDGTGADEDPESLPEDWPADVSGVATGETCSIVIVLMILRPLSLSDFVGLRPKTS